MLTFVFLIVISIYFFVDVLVKSFHLSRADRGTEVIAFVSSCLLFITSIIMLVIYHR